MSKKVTNEWVSYGEIDLGVSCIVYAVSLEETYEKKRQVVEMMKEEREALRRHLLE